MANVFVDDAYLTAIANAIRGKTGSADTYTPAQMAAVISSISGGGASGIYMARVTPETDMKFLTIQHNLGTTDILLAAIFAQTLGEITPSFNGVLARFWAKTDIPMRLTASVNGSNFQSQFSYQTSTLNAAGGVPNSTSYCCYVVDENTFQFTSAGSSAAKYMAGITYTVIIIAANAEV